MEFFRNKIRVLFKKIQAQISIAKGKFLDKSQSDRKQSQINNPRQDVPFSNSDNTWVFLLYLTSNTNIGHFYIRNTKNRDTEGMIGEIMSLPVSLKAWMTINRIFENDKDA